MSNFDEHIVPKEFDLIPVGNLLISADNGSSSVFIKTDIYKPKRLGILIKTNEFIIRNIQEFNSSKKFFHSNYDITIDKKSICIETEIQRKLPSDGRIYLDSEGEMFISVCEENDHEQRAFNIKYDILESNKNYDQKILTAFKHWTIRSHLPIELIKNNLKNSNGPFFESF